MKNYFILLVLFLSFSTKAQESGSLSLNLYGGYNFSDKVDFDMGYVNVKEGFQWGVGLEYFVQKYSSVELKYLRIDTKMEAFVGNTQINAGDDKGAVNNILVDFTQYFDAGSSKLLPYIGGGLGMGIVESPKNGNQTTFAWDIKLGAKIKTSSAVSVNLQAYLQSMSSAVGNDIFYTWYGPVYVTDYATLYQFGLGAVISYNFKN